MLENQIEWINGNGGLAWANARTARVVIRPLRLGRGVGATPRRSSPTPTTGRRWSSRSTSTEAIDAAAVAAALRANGIVDTEPYRKLGRNQLRIATFVAVEPDDVRRLISSIDYVVSNLH